MADADVQITAGSGTKIDTRTVGAGSDEHRQVVVIGDPATSSNVAPVTAAGGLTVTNASLSGTALATAITVGTTAVALPASPLSGRRTLLVQSDVSNNTYVYVGGSGVTTSTGIMLTSGQTIALDVAGAAVYAIAGAASQTVRIIEVS